MAAQQCKPTKQVDVDLGTRGYRIHAGPGLLDRAVEVIDLSRPARVLIVTNTAVAPLHAQRLQRALAERFSVDMLVLPDGEAFKRMDVVASIHTRLLATGCGRDALVIALGGGVVGDVAGFAAATYQRGIDYVQVPTTLLAQVDSSVGGKTGVNHALGKNMVGAFHQPRSVIADLDTLTTLPAREYSAGLAEVVKYGLLGDHAFIDWLIASTDALMARDAPTLAEVVRRSCQNKADIVVADEYESGQRALLNLGHTFGHAIETELGYGVWLHGEAVAAGMCMAADMSARLGLLDAAECPRIESLIAALGLPTEPPRRLSRQRLRTAMARDKKTSAGQLQVIVLRAIGDAVVMPAEEPALDATLARYLG
ncbi:3-dehydroquinate synthase [Salinisphaera sp. USBA-960]|nr:3-dehydroquinate synthase [Salifodinibacter halophilus]NNC26879.1 3-dehydroquinate synthase [Salifodinibacter halophilus]